MPRFGLARTVALRERSALLDTSNPYLTKDEAAEFLRVSPRTLSRWQAEGSGPPRIKRGRLILYSRQSLVTWLQSHETLGPGQQ